MDLRKADIYKLNSYEKELEDLEKQKKKVQHLIKEKKAQIKELKPVENNP